MNMKHFLLAGVAVTLSAAAATAQDWTGSYFGASIGYGKGTYTQGVSALGQLGVDVSVKDAMFGIRGGYNMQSGNTVYGFDAEISTGIDGITPQGTLGPDWSCNTGDCNVDVKSLLTVRGRYGVLADPKTLIYGAAGIAAGRVSGGIFNSAQQGSSTAYGYTVGLGIEHQTSDRSTVFGEVNYVDLGTLDFGTGIAPADRFDGRGDFVTIKIGMNFRF